MAVPVKLPRPAAPAIAPSARVPSTPPIVPCMKNGEKIVRKPVSPRSVATPRSAVTTRIPSERRPRPVSTPVGPGINTEAGSSPSEWSTCVGSRSATIPAAVNTTTVSPSSQLNPNSAATPAPMPANTPPVMIPKIDSLAFAVTSVMSPGSTRGTTAPRSTPYDLDSTSAPNAAGYNAKLS